MSNEHFPFVSIVTPVYNDSARLKVMLAHLEAQTYPKDKFEVIVVDNASKEPVEPALVDSPRARIVREMRAGPDVARNTGIAASTADFLAFTDSDTLPHPDWLETGVRTLSNNPDCGLVGGRIDVFPEDPNNLTLVELFESIFAFNTKANIEVHHFMPTANMFTRRSVFEKVGMFNGDLIGGVGDEEWGQRVHAAGYRLVYNEKLAVRHPARRTMAELNKKNRRVTFGYVNLLRRRSPGTPVAFQSRYFRRLFILPLPSEIRPILRARHPSLWEKLKLVGIVFWNRCYRAYYMVRALLPHRKALW